jgi:5-carboxyvanillate decarboxylase
MRAARPRRIATEEAFSTPEVATELGRVAERGGTSADLLLVTSIYHPRTTDSQRGALLPKLLDLDDTRITDMDDNGVDIALMMLTAPGVQMFDPDTAVALATLSNDQLADACGRHPGRYAPMATFAPQRPDAAAMEMARAVDDLGFHGFVVNSHTDNEYLDHERYRPVLEAAESLRRPLYIHPRAPSDRLAGPSREFGMDGASWGFGIEVGTHVVRLMLSGVLDRFPDLQLVIGHMGEAVPFWLWRIDYMNGLARRAGRAPALSMTPSEYFQRNFTITTSGVEDPLALDYSISKLGIEKIMWAIDYPYQPSAPAVAFMDAAPVTEAERAALYHGNAERVFGIDPVRTSSPDAVSGHPPLPPL